MERRTFLALASAAATPAASTQYQKGICGVIFPAAMPLAEQFRQTRAAGFEGIEIRLGGELSHDTAPDAARRIGEAARKEGVTIVSLWVSDALSASPLNHPEAGVREKGVQVIRQAIDVAALTGCGALLIVPGRLGSGAKFQYSYQDTWNRVTGELKKVISRAAKAKVVLTPENVWNKFLVSPLEMRAFVDHFKSPWLQTHFDTGNVMQFGYPQDWILTLGQRIKRVHVKDYKLSARAEQGRFVDLLEGDVDWKDVMASLNRVGYRGFLSPEIGHRAGDPDQLKKVSQALDKILALA